MDPNADTTNTTTTATTPTAAANTIPTPGLGGGPYQHLLAQQQQQLQMFWSYQRQEIESVNDFKNHQLPLARIKKIMKADEDVRMISAEAPILFAKACELFILELTIRSWLHAEENKRRTLQKNDIAAAITRTDIFDFLVDIVPREDLIKDSSASAATGADAVLVAGGATASGVPYYYPPVGQPAPGAGMMMGRPAAGMDHHHHPHHAAHHPPHHNVGLGVGVGPGMYVGQQQPSQAWQSVWQASAEDGGVYGGGNGAGAAGQPGSLDG